jgi:hypothetical protein
MEFTDDGALFKGINALRALRERGRGWFQYFYLVSVQTSRPILQLNVN